LKGELRFRLSISPRKQLWIKAVKKLTSERLGRESLAAWEEGKSCMQPDQEAQEMDDRTKKSSDASADTEVAYPGTEQTATDTEGTY
jgi:hypothetical protein